MHHHICAKASRVLGRVWGRVWVWMMCKGEQTDGRKMHKEREAQRTGGRCAKHSKLEGGNSRNGGTTTSVQRQVGPLDLMPGSSCVCNADLEHKGCVVTEMGLPTSSSIGLPGTEMAFAQHFFLKIPKWCSSCGCSSAPPKSHGSKVLDQARTALGPLWPPGLGAKHRSSIKAAIMQRSKVLDLAGSALGRSWPPGLGA